MNSDRLDGSDGECLHMQMWYSEPVDFIPKELLHMAKEMRAGLGFGRYGKTCGSEQMADAYIRGYFLTPVVG